MEHHYPLQALLYGVGAPPLSALEGRHLDAPADVVTGAAYLFVRGMTGTGVATTPW